MRFYSITFKLLVLIICGFIITGVSVTIAADLQLTRIIDRSQSDIYAEKIDTILNSFTRSNERLKQTGMVEAYSKDFKEAALKEFRQSYYSRSNQSIYPFIIDKRGLVVQHPILLRGDNRLTETTLVKNMLSTEQGSFNYTYDGEKKWYIFRHFSEWNWIIAYNLPLEIKYGDAIIFRNILIIIIAIVTIVVLLLLSFIVASFTRPITALTAITAEMAAGKLDQEIIAGGKDEIGTLANSFIRMRDAITGQLAELKTERNRAANILEGTNAGTWEWNITTNEVTMNERWAEIRGYTLKELGPTTLNTWKQFILPEDLPRVKELLDSHLRGELDYFDIEYRELNKEGYTIWIGSRGKVVEWSPDGIPLRMSGIDMDISNRKMVEAELSHLRNYLSNIINSMPSILVGVDPNGIITQWNMEAERKTGLKAEEALGRRLEQSLPRISAEKERITEAIKSRKVQVTPRKVRKENNRTVFEDITIYPLISNGIEGAVIRIDDVSKEHEMEEQLSHHRKMDAIGQLAGGVAHDFNNTLTGIIGAAQILKIKRADLDEELLDFVDIILQASTRAADLTAKLLAFGRKGKITSTEIDIHKVIEDTIAILNRTIDKRIKLEVKNMATCSMIAGDISALQNALMNICINSSHAMPEGGELSILTKNIKLNITYCEASPFEIEPGDYIEIEIRDTGCGIPLENIHKIFEPFYTTKKHGKGTGLGLAAVYGTVQDHHGAVNVYSEEGEGTAFHLLFPCSAMPTLQTGKEEKLLKGTGLILLVDDEEIIRVTGKYLLKNMGYKVLIAENGREALEIFKQRYEEIDLVIMDMIMPIMNGREAFLKMKEIDKSCKVLISSGFTKDEGIDELTKQGLSGFIHKPYRDVELSRLMARILSNG